MDFPSLKLSVVGGRPFSHGGNKLHRDKLLLKRLAFIFHCENASSCMFSIYIIYLSKHFFFSWNQIFAFTCLGNGEETIHSLYRKNCSFVGFCVCGGDNCEGIVLSL